MHFSAVVLAAGASSRMPGNNKLLLPLAGKSVIAHTVDNLLQARVTEIIVVLGFDADKIQAALRDRNVRFVMNPDYAQGMSASIIAGIRAMSPEAEALFICLGDLPLVTAPDFDRLITAFQQAPQKAIAVPVFQSQRGNPVIFDVCHKSEMLALRGDVGCKTILAQHPQQVLEVEMAHDHILRDVDTPEAYRAILEQLQF